MPEQVKIENIEALRSQEGIEDGELRAQIEGLKVGDCVKLTFLCGPRSFETLVVRITNIKGSAFRGKLVAAPASAGLAELHAGSLVAFTTAHIHSFCKGQPAHGH